MSATPITNLPKTTTPHASTAAAAITTTHATTTSAKFKCRSFYTPSVTPKQIHIPLVGYELSERALADAYDALSANTRLSEEYVRFALGSITHCLRRMEQYEPEITELKVVDVRCPTLCVANKGLPSRCGIYTSIDVERSLPAALDLPDIKRNSISSLSSLSTAFSSSSSSSSSSSEPVLPSLSVGKFGSIRDRLRNKLRTTRPHICDEKKVGLTKNKLISCASMSTLEILKTTSKHKKKKNSTLTSVFDSDPSTVSALPDDDEIKLDTYYKSVLRLNWFHPVKLIDLATHIECQRTPRSGTFEIGGFTVYIRSKQWKIESLPPLSTTIADAPQIPQSQSPLVAKTSVSTPSPSSSSSSSHQGCFFLFCLILIAY